MGFMKELDKSGVKLTHDSTLPPGERTIKNFKRVIAAVRAAEADAQDQIHAANESCREAQDKVILLQERLRVVENELKQFKIKERLEELQSVTANDRMRLLEAAN